MKYAELDLYDQQGGEEFQKKINKKDEEILNDKDRKILRVYKKKIIEQRNEIEELKKKINKLENK